KADRTVKLSAKSGDGLEELQQVLEDVLRGQKILIDRIYTYEEAGKIQLIRKYGELLVEDYQPEGIGVKAYVPLEIYKKVE
ncbi:MAG: GTPase HflX, partial [Lachnospiraceae bacterium]